MRWLIVALALFASACGDDSGRRDPLPPPQPPVVVLSPAQQASAALASWGTLPLFPLTPPTVDDPRLSPEGVLIDERNGTFNPAMIARFALERYSRWQTKQPSTGEDFIATALRQTDWLAANIDCKAAIGVWRYGFPASFDAQPGWASGFANGHAVAALLIMSRFIPDPQRYIEPALCGIEAFDVDVSEGGLKTTLGGGGGKWYEEYAVSSRSGVMNGQVYALAGLHYACRYARVAQACDLFDEGGVALKTRLHLFDSGFTSMYSLVNDNFASPGYNQLHGQVLRWLDQVSPDPTIRRYAELFEDYEAETTSPTATFTADAVNHGTQFLSDGYWWYGYWSAYGLPVDMDVVVPSGRARAIAIAFAGDEVLPFRYAPVLADGTVGSFVDAPSPTTKRRYVQQEFHTAVGVYPLDVAASKIRLRFTTPIPTTDVVAVREINVLK